MQTFYCVGGFHIRLDPEHTWIVFKSMGPETGHPVPVAVGAMPTKDAVEMAMIILKLKAGVPLDTNVQISFPTPEDQKPRPFLGVDEKSTRGMPAGPANPEVAPPLLDTASPPRATVVDREAAGVAESVFIDQHPPETRATRRRAQKAIVNGKPKV